MDLGSQVGTGREGMSTHTDAGARFPWVTLGRTHCISLATPTTQLLGHRHIFTAESRRGSSQMSLPPAQNFPKRGSPSSPTIWQGSLSLCQAGVAMQMQMPVLLPYLGTSGALGPWGASAALQGTRGHY